MNDQAGQSEKLEEQQTVLGAYNGAFFKMITDTQYKTHEEAIIEAVQNSVDANATDIWVTINYRKRNITIRDNGDGVTLQRMNEVLLLKGKPKVKTGKNKNGQYNIGFLAPLGKSEYFTFSSKSKQSDAPYYRWLFRPEEIFVTASGIPVPREQLPLNYSTKPEKVTNGVMWRSEVAMVNLIFENARNKPKAQKLALECIKRFRQSILASKLDVKFHFTEIDGKGSIVHKQTYMVEDYAGKRLAVWSASAKSRKQTRIELYLSKRSGRKFSGAGLNFHVLNDPWGVDVSDFLKQCRNLELLDNKSLITALSNGMFEGKIASSLLELMPDRKTFKETDNLVEFLIHLDNWWVEVGQALYEAANNDEPSQLFSYCAKKAQKEFKQLLDNPDVKKLLDSLKKSGNDESLGKVSVTTPIGDEVIDGSHGPYDEPGKKPNSPNPPTTTVDSTKTKKSGGPTRGSKVPKGVKVTSSSRDSGDSNKHQELRLEESTELDSDTPWQISSDGVTVLVNIEHYYYTICYEDESSRNRRITDYQKKVLFQALALVSSGFSSSDSEWYVSQEILFQELLLEVLTITN